MPNFDLSALREAVAKTAPHAYGDETPGQGWKRVVDAQRLLINAAPALLDEVARLRQEREALRAENIRLHCEVENWKATIETREADLDLLVGEVGAESTEGALRELSSLKADLARVKEEDRLVMKELERTLKAIGGSDDITAAKQQASHERCHDLVCSGSRDYPRGEKGHTCSCASRDTAFSDLAAARAVLGGALEHDSDVTSRPARIWLSVDLAAWQAWKDGQR
jgi:hypothetical protein